MDLLVKPIAAICRSLAEENGLRIRLAIGGGKESISQIVESTRFSQPLVSDPFQELRRLHSVTVDVIVGISVPSSVKAVS
jgi:hypothetical protein